MQFDTTSDFHTHTSYSDGASSVEEMCLAAVGHGLRRIAITDHMPLPFATRYAMARAEIGRYRQEIECARHAFGDRLSIVMGLEIEYIAAHADWIRAIVALGWDHLIVSIHHLPGKDRLHLVNGHDFEFAPLFEEFAANPAALCRNYYATLQEAVATGLFTCVGHLDVLKKWQSSFGHIDETSGWYRALILETLDHMARYGTMLEINTAGMNHGPRQQYPSGWIVTEAVKRGIPLVLGSDAHSSRTLGQHFSMMGERFGKWQLDGHQTQT